MANPCPTPRKDRYATLEAAEAGARRSEWVFTIARLYTYDCDCGWIHLTKRPPDKVPADTAPDPAIVKQLAGLSAVLFTDAVTRDVRGVLSTAERIALRHPSLLVRWKSTLEWLRLRVDTQLADRADHIGPEVEEWRCRARTYMAALDRRRHENARLLEAAAADPRTDVA